MSALSSLADPGRNSSYYYDALNVELEQVKMELEKWKSGDMRYQEVFDVETGVVTSSSLSNSSGKRNTSDDDDKRVSKRQKTTKSSSGNGSVNNNNNNNGTSLLSRLVKVKEERNDKAGDLEDANETLEMQARTTDIWQGRFDEVYELAKNNGVDVHVLNTIRDRSVLESPPTAPTIAPDTTTATTTTNTNTTTTTTTTTTPEITQSSQANVVMPTVYASPGKFTNRVTVAYKFASRRTYLVSKNYGLQGELLIPLLQDPETGYTRFNDCPTEFIGKITGYDPVKQEDFTEEFKCFYFHNSKGQFKIWLGIELEMLETGPNNRHFLMTSPDTKLQMHQLLSREPRRFAASKASLEETRYFTTKARKDVDGTHIKNWMKNQGGNLNFYWHSSAYNWGDGNYEDMGFETRIVNGKEEIEEGVLEDYTLTADAKIKFYTVLSAHKSFESRTTKKSLKDWGYESNDDDNELPHWEKLEKRVSARFPNKPPEWSKKAVVQYKYFLELKKEHKDWKSEKFSPSAMIDEVWHTHLSFNLDYTLDILKFTGGHLIEHSPVLGDKPRQNYIAAYKEAKKKKYNLDIEFWPPVIEQPYESDHDGDSDAFIHIPAWDAGPHCG